MIVPFKLSVMDPPVGPPLQAAVNFVLSTSVPTVIVLDVSSAMV